MSTSFKPFADESATLELSTDTKQDATLTIENRLDAVEIYGSIRIAPDAAGRAAAVELRDLMLAIIERIDAGDHPTTPATTVDTVANPLGN